MKYYYYAATTVYKDPDPEHPYRTVSLSKALRISESANLAHALKDYVVVIPCSTYKRAKEIADNWQEGYVASGNYPTDADWDHLRHWKKLSLDELNALRNV